MSPRPRWSVRRRVLTSIIVFLVLIGVGVANRPIVAAAADRYHEYEVGQPGYQSKNGAWAYLNVPAAFKINAIHAAMLPTGKVLIVAGSGNRENNFDAGKFKTIVWDPATNHFTLVATPVDLFCSGHAFLPNGNLLIAGGTRRYEVLAANVKRAGGAMTIRNESPNGGSHTLPKGTELVSKTTGIVYHTTAAVTYKPATKKGQGKNTKTIGSQVQVFVEAVKDGKNAGVSKKTQFTIKGLKGQVAKDVYGVAQNINYKKQEYQGLDTSFEFNPFTEKYERVGNLNYSRWYPTLAPLQDGSVLAVSGLDQLGNMVPGKIEKYNLTQKKWIEQPKLNRVFSTYPSLFLTKDNKLFFSGSVTGYGSVTEGRQPGIWDLTNNSFKKVSGLTDTDQLETSASLMLAPAQDQKVMILGGGGIGESPKSTKRTAVIDLDAANPTYKQTADLPNPTRYLGAVLLPDDTVFTTNGSERYRGSDGSDLLTAQIYHPDTNKFDPVAPPRVGRNYHSEAMLLPDGRVISMGGDPLYRGKNDYRAGIFEQRIEIYTPPYLLNGTKRPTITAAPATTSRGKTIHVSTPDVADLKNARLIRPSSVTHVTDIEQRSLALTMKATGDGVDLTIPTGSGLVPSGYYMLFLVSKEGTPSVAKWVKVS